MEKSIKLLFTTKDVSNCKTYIQNQLRKLLEERVALSDYIFAKEYRGEHSYRPGACVPALTLARSAHRQYVYTFTCYLFTYVRMFNAGMCIRTVCDDIYTQICVCMCMYSV